MIKLTKYFNGLLYLVNPSLCQLCKKPILKEEDILCCECFFRLPKTTINESNIKLLFYDIKPLRRILCLYKYEKNNSIQKLIHNLKYKNKKNVGIFFGKEISKMLRNKNLANDFDFIVPLPIHKKKEKERGYNQSFTIAKEIGNQLNIPVKNFILKKTVTESQTRKRYYARWENQENKFTLTKKKYLNGK